MLASNHYNSFLSDDSQMFFKYKMLDFLKIGSVVGVEKRGREFCYIQGILTRVRTEELDPI